MSIKRQKKAETLLEILEIPYVKNQKIQNLSGGEKQRIAINIIKLRP